MQTSAEITAPGKAATSEVREQQEAASDPGCHASD